MNSCRTADFSPSRFSADSSAVMMLICQPVSSEASRTFCPPRPMAIARFSSSTTTSIAWRSSSTTIELTLAGASAPMTNCAGSSDHSTMSTRSPDSSLVTACTREPRMPTQVPIGSMRRSLVHTAILARTPGSRAADLICSSPCSISGTSSSNSFIRNSGEVRDRITAGPRCVRSILATQARTRSPMRRFSLPMVSLRGSRASILPISTMKSPLSIRLMVPLTTSSPRARNSVSSCSRSASRIFCRITCLVSCAKRRPNSCRGSCSSMYSSTSMSGIWSRASDRMIWCPGSCRPASSGTTSQRRKAS